MRLGEKERRMRRNKMRQNKAVPTKDQQLDKKIPVEIKPGLTVLISPDQDPEIIRQRYLNDH